MGGPLSPIAAPQQRLGRFRQRLQGEKQEHFLAVLLDEEDVTLAIRAEDVSAGASRVAAAARTSS